MAKRHEVILLLAFLAIAAISFTGCASAPNTLARNSAPTPILYSQATACLTNAAQVLPGTEAAKFCLDARRLEVERGTKIAESASKAASATARNNGCSPLYGCGGGIGGMGGIISIGGMGGFGGGGVCGTPGGCRNGEGNIVPQGGNVSGGNGQGQSGTNVYVIPRR